MRRKIAAALFTTGLAVGVAGPASAASERPLFMRQVQVSGDESFELGANGCNFVYEEIDLAYKGGTIEITGCVDFADNSAEDPIGFPFVFDGSFVLTGKNGTATGSVTGNIDGSPDGPANFTLTVEEGTKRFRNATGDTLLVINDFFDHLTGTLSPQS